METSLLIEALSLLMSRLSSTMNPRIIYPMKIKIKSSDDPMRLYINTKPDSEIANKDTLILLRLFIVDLIDSKRREKLEVRCTARLARPAIDPRNKKSTKTLTVSTAGIKIIPETSITAITAVIGVPERDEIFEKNGFNILLLDME